MSNMNRIICFLLSIVLIVSMTNNSINKFKVDSTIKLINEELVLDSVSYYSLLDYDEHVMYLDKEKLKLLVENTIKENLMGCKYQIRYYFYNQNTMESSEKYPNSVQIKLIINYQKTEYEYVLRFEPEKGSDKNKTYI